ncbi:MAG TPA: hypothetical protein VHY34_09975, partial [Caulobacteraceae bacterium]|nr:hypothetical protein [Caulobacteraceae bacterium]
MFRRRALLIGLATGLVAGSAWAAVDDKPPPSLPKPSAQAPAVVAAWLTQHTSIAPASVVSVGDEYIVAVLSSRALDPAHPRVLHLEIRAEMTDPDSQAASVLRSMSATLEINCTEHTSHFIEVRTFALPNLMGAEQVNHPSEGWVSNPRGSYFEDIDAAVCTPNGPRPLASVHAEAPATPASIPADQTLSEPLRPSQAPDAPLPHAATPRTTRPAPVKAPQVEAHSGGQAQIIAAPSEAKAQEAL